MALSNAQTTITIERETRIGDVTTRQISYWEKLMLQNAHPIRLICNVMAVMWSVFYAYHHNVTMAVIMAVVFLGAGIGIVKTDNLNRFVDTKRGQFLMALNNPLSLMLDILGLAVLFYAVWNHSVVLTLCAVSTVAISRIFAAYRYLGR